MRARRDDERPTSSGLTIMGASPSFRHTNLRPKGRTPTGRTNVADFPATRLDRKGDQRVDQQASKITVTIIGAGLGASPSWRTWGCRLPATPARHRRRSRIAADPASAAGLDVEGLGPGLGAAGARDAATSRPRSTAPTSSSWSPAAHFHADVARGARRASLRDGQTILLIQGGTGGSLVVRQRAARGPAAAPRSTWPRWTTTPTRSSWPEPTRVRDDDRQALPADRRAPRRARSTPCSPGSRPLLSRRRWPRRASSTTGLTNMNATLHVANMVGNIGRLEAGGNGYRFYAEGYTPSP